MKTIRFTLWLLITAAIGVLNAQTPTVVVVGKDTLVSRQWVRDYVESQKAGVPVSTTPITPPVLPEAPTVTAVPVVPIADGCQMVPAGGECIWLNGTDGIEYSGTTLTGGNKKRAIDNWYADGGKVIQMTVDWHDMEASAGAFNPDTKNKVLAVLNYLQSKNMELYLKLHMTITHLQCLGGCPAHIYDISSDGVKTSNGNTYQNGGGVPLTFSSPKVANMERYWAMMAQLLQPYRGMIFLSVTTEPNQEMQYVIDAPTDYHPLEEKAWQQFQQTKYGNSLGSQPYSFDGDKGRRWMRFKSHQLQQFAYKWGVIFNEVNIRTIYDCGSFSDQIIWRGNWAVPTKGLKPEISGLKDNPDSGGQYDIELIAGLTTSYNSNLNLLESTYSPNQDIGTNINRIYEEIVRAKKAGSHYINFSFFSNYYDTGSPNYQVAHAVMQRLRENGYLAKKQVCGGGCNTTVIDFKASKALQSGGFMGAYSAEYHSYLNSCQGYPRINVIDDL